jgi:hypothetical protein
MAWQVGYATRARDTLQMMRHELVEAVLIGATIGLTVVAIRTLADSESSPYQGLALALAGASLCCLQLVLVLRRARRRNQPPADRPTSPQPPIRKRPSRHNPFAQELTRNWTGLDDHAPTVDEQPAEESSEQADEAP